MNEETKTILINLMKNSEVGSLATSVENIPNVSMVSYSVSNLLTEIYIFVSQLAKHTQNLLTNPNYSFLLINSKNGSSNPQQFERVTINGKAEIIERSNKNFENAKEIYISKNPKSKMLFGLGDFIMFKLNVEHVRFVAGFAQTYDLTKESLVNIQ